MSSTSPLSNKVTWYSSAVDVAQIDDKGILTGINTGSVDVKASYEGIGVILSTFVLPTRY
ncbi:Ig-like domain-containing protein [Photobacterium leiognathi]|uniref:Ig-like domain-containing protein n=1 Tax=Photobacterium leiognathi TaxID=553611 RepID=UPI0034E43FA4